MKRRTQYKVMRKGKGNTYKEKNKVLSNKEKGDNL